MPVFKSGKENVPLWCEMENFEIIRLHEGETRSYSVNSPKEKWIVGNGNCVFTKNGEPIEAKRGVQVDFVREDGQITVGQAAAGTLVIRMVGHWGEEVGGSGLFFVKNADERKDLGDTVDYEKKTNFDKHYHDCDEYWIIYEGKGIAVSENKSYEVGPGDCVATGRGFHHDFPVVLSDEPVTAVFFETTLEGQKRRGHLWNHTHGNAEPAQERV